MTIFCIWKNHIKTDCGIWLVSGQEEKNPKGRRSRLPRLSPVHHFSKYGLWPPDLAAPWSCWKHRVWAPRPRLVRLHFSKDPGRSMHTLRAVWDLGLTPSDHVYNQKEASGTWRQDQLAPTWGEGSAQGMSPEGATRVPTDVPSASLGRVPTELGVVL
jgi:hypothetical protein